jgi:hypothetical protein
VLIEPSKENLPDRPKLRKKKENPLPPPPEIRHMAKTGMNFMKSDNLLIDKN